MYAKNGSNTQNNLEKCTKKLSKKVENIKLGRKHIMSIEQDFQNFDFQTVLKDLEDFLNSDLMNFENYEKWLEDGVEPN